MKEIKELSLSWITGEHEVNLPGNVKFLSCFYTDGIKVLYEIENRILPQRLFVLSMRASEDFLPEGAKFFGTIINDGESIHLFIRE